MNDKVSPASLAATVGGDVEESRFTKPSFHRADTSIFRHQLLKSGLLPRIDVGKLVFFLSG